VSSLLKMHIIFIEISS